MPEPKKESKLLIRDAESCCGIAGGVLNAGGVFTSSSPTAGEGVIEGVAGGHGLCVAGDSAGMGFFIFEMTVSWRRSFWISVQIDLRRCHMTVHTYPSLARRFVLVMEEL